MEGDAANIPGRLMGDEFFLYARNRLGIRLSYVLGSGCFNNTDNGIIFQEKALVVAKSLII